MEGVASYINTLIFNTRSNDDNIHVFAIQIDKIVLIHEQYYQNDNYLFTIDLINGQTCEIETNEDIFDEILDCLETGSAENSLVFNGGKDLPVVNTLSIVPTGK